MLPLVVGLGAGAIAAFTAGLEYNEGEPTWYGHELHRQDPLDPVMRPIIKLRKFDVDGQHVKRAAGGLLMGWGTAMLIPGPVDFTLAIAGTAAFKHPWGGVAAVAGYNLFAASVFGTGYYLSSS